MVLSDGAVATVVAQSSTKLLVTFSTAPSSVGSMTAVVTTDGAGSGSPVEVATITPVVTQSTSSLSANSSTLTFHGLGFDPTGTNTVTLSSGVETVTAVTATTLTITFSTAPTAGALTIVDITDGVSRGTSVEVATILPVVTLSSSILPANASTLTIIGVGFDSIGSNTVTLSSGEGTVTAVTSTSLTITFSTAPTAGPLTAIVITDGVSSGTPVEVATAIPVVTLSVSNLAENAPSFTITGLGFDPSGTNSVVLSDGAVATVTAVSPTQLLATFTTQPTSTGTMTAVVTTDGAGSGSPVEVATILPASTPTVSPNTVSLTVISSEFTITGTGFDMTGTNIVALSNGASGTAIANSPTQLTVTFTTDPTTSGLMTAVVTTDGVSSGSPVDVATIAPVPFVMSNTSNLPETAPSFMITGTGFDPSGTNTVVLSDGASGTVVANSTTQLTVTFTTQPTSTGLMTAVVTTDGVSSGSPVDVATITVPPSPPTAPLPTSPPPASPPTVIAAQPVLVGGELNGTVNVYTESNGTYTLQETLQPFGNIPTDVRTAVGDVNGDGIPDFIFAIGPSPTTSTGAAIAATATEFKVMVLSGAAGNPVLVQPFDPFLPNPGGSPFTAGGFVSAGDFLNNGRTQIAISPDQQGGPRIAIYDMNGAATAGPQAATPVGVNTTEINPGSGLTRINNFLSVNPDFRGGARTAVGDLNGDGTPDIAIAAGFGGGPAVLVINGTKIATTTGFTNSDDLITDFFAFNSTLRDGAYLAIGDVFGTGQQDLILGPGAGGPAEVEVLNGTQLIDTGAVATIASPAALFTPTGLGPNGSGLRVAVAATGVGDDVNVIVGAGRNMPGVAKVYPGSGFTSGSTTEPTGGQLLNPFGGSALTDGIFVG